MVDEYVRRLEALGFPVLKGSDSGAEGAPAGGAEGAAGDQGASQGAEEPPKDDVLDGIKARKEQGKATQVELRLLELHDSDVASKSKIEQLTQAVKDKDELQRQLDEIARKDQTELENATGDLKKAQDRLATLEGTLRKALLENAIRNEEAFTWHDVSDVISALDDSAIKVDLEQGTIEGLAGELKRVASKKPHYVKSKKGEKKVAEQQPQTPQQPSGANPYNVGSTHNAEASRKSKLRETYPILRNA